MDPLSVLQRLGTGRLIEELAEALTAASEEVVATGKPATVTLKLAVHNRSQGDPLVMIDEQISRSSPKRDPRGAIFYALDGGLYREDPRQIPMAFRSVDTQTGEIKEAQADDDVRELG